jgi:hypothetical protein
LQVSADQFVGLTGLLNNFPNTTCGPLLLIEASDFATVTWISTSALPLSVSQYSLLTISTRIQNTGMVWDGTSTIHDDWGTAPTLMYPVNLILRLTIEADSLRVYPLNEWGQSMDIYQVYLPGGPDQFDITLDQELDQTLWYSIEKFGTGTAIGDQRTEMELPDQYKLEQNYPNPFNPVTIIRYQLPVSGHVTLTVYDALGRRITVLVNKNQSAGYYSYEWKQAVGSGIYFYHLQAGDFSESKKMILIR